jgi:hypothetical protein
MAFRYIVKSFSFNVIKYHKKFCPAKTAIIFPAGLTLVISSPNILKDLFL